MHNFKFLILALCILLNYGTAEAKYPVDISIMISDLKYSQEHGVKICEVQHGSLSAFNGDVYIWGGKGVILPKIGNFFDQFPVKKWTAGLTHSPLKITFSDKEWELQETIKKLFKNPQFLDDAVVNPSDPTSIDAYSCLVYGTHDLVKNFDRHHEAYPGALFIDAATFPYWVNKEKMSALFNQNTELKGYKADWEVYPKTYDSDLAARIKENMPSELYVIKPKGEFLANGVIVVESEELDNTLQLILEPKKSLKKHSDKSYAFWLNNKDDFFIIEKYYTSDYLHFSENLTLKNKSIAEVNSGDFRYDGTMRIAFILVYNEGKMSYHGLGGYWKLPCKALEEKGTLNQRRISCGEDPFFRSVDPKTLKAANEELERAMLLLYEIMLNAE